MGLIDSGSKSSRLLASRRYTHNTLTSAQEAFTNVLDLRSEEIYTRANLIPSSSLPFSGSSQNGLTFSKNGKEVVKYYYRHELTKSNINNEVYFFLNPTGSVDGIGAQLIDDNQQTNFISPKYSISSLANSTTEDSTPGYLAVLYKSSTINSHAETGSLGSGDIVSTNDYQFDYKTGVVQFLNSDKDPVDDDSVFMTVYQYVGDTLNSGLEVDGEVTASNLLVTGTLKTTNIESTEMTLATASIAAITSSISRLDTESSLATASIAAITSSVSRINDDITLATASIEAITSSLSTLSGTGELQGLGTTSSPVFNSVTASADVSASGNIFATGNLDIDGTSNFASDVTIDSDLDVTGTITATEIHTTFISSSISVATGSNNFGDTTDDHHSFTGSVSVSSSLSVTGSATIDGTLTADEIGAFTAAGAIDFNDQNMTNVDIDSGDITGVTFGTAASTTITGSTTALSSSIATRFDSRETDMTLATASIASNETNMTLATASIAAITASVSTINDNMTLATASIAAITASVSRINTEIDTNTTNITLATASIEAITSSIARLDSETETNDANMTLATASIEAITSSLGTISGTGELQGLGTTSSPLFNAITASAGISSSGQVDINTDFAQLRLSDDGMKDFISLGQSGAVGYIKTSDADNNFKFRRGNDNTDLLEIFFGEERVHISGSAGLDVTGHITASGNISSSGIIIADTFQSTGGNVDGISFTDDLDITGNITASGGVSIGEMSIPSVSTMSSSIATRFDSRETDMTLATASIAAITASVAEMKEFTKAATISGSFTSVSSSIATRFDSREVDMTLATASIAAITASVAEMKEFTNATTISGSFTAVSSSIATRFDSRETDMALATASIAALTASISRLNDEISTDDTDMNLATASIAAITASISRIDSEIDTNVTNITLATASIAAITASIAEMKPFTNADTISGSFTSLSGSIATRFDSRETDMTLATASIAAITASVAEMKEFTNADTISGSFTSVSSSIATRFDARETDMNLATASIAAITASISRLNDEISTDDTDMNLATASIAAITASIARLDSETETNAANITLATASIAAITASLGQPVNTDSDVTFGNITSTGTITAVEVHTTFVSSSITVTSGSNNFGDATDDHHSFTGSVSVSSSLSIAGSATVDGTLTADEIGAFTAGGAIDFNDQNMTNVDIDSGDITGVTFGTATSTIISGSFTSVSSSIATRFDSNESDMTLATASIAAITASVSRIDSEIDTNTTNITLATASIAAITSSISELKTSATLSTASIAAITASISRIDGELDDAGIFEQTGSFYRTHNDIQITGSLSVSGLITGSFSGLGAGQKYKHVQTTPSSTWTVSHGFDYQYVNIDVYNGSDELVIPASVVATDSNTITISFNTPLSGVAIVSTGGQAVDELGKNVIFEQSTVSTNWRVTHSIGEQYPAVTVYDESDNVIIPERISAVDASKMDIIFADAISGHANISVGGGQLRNAITGSEQLSFDSFGDISGSVSSTGSFGRLEVVGNGNIDGNLTLGGNITIGDADSDSITINADLTSNLIPNADSTFDIGSTSKFWRNAYIDSITTTGNVSGSITSTGSFGNVNVSEMSIPSVSVMSSSIATRFDSRETDMTLATASIAAITSSVAEMKEFTNADTISGSFTSVSSSIASRLDSLSGDVIALSIALG